jgi:hypothetical protein
MHFVGMRRSRQSCLPDTPKSLKLNQERTLGGN